MRVTVCRRFALHHAPQVLFEGWLDDAPLGDERRDETVGRHVELRLCGSFVWSRGFGKLSSRQQERCPSWPKERDWKSRRRC